MTDTLSTEFIVVGSGIAGLRAAIEIASAERNVLLLTKDLPTDSSTEHAQGGIAAALGEEDEIALHERDTIAAGDGLCDPEAVRVLVEEGPRCIYELIDWGAEFDRDGLRLAFAREGAHSKHRVLHARGDSTGSEIVRALLLKASTFPNIRFMKKTFTAALTMDQDRCSGVLAIDESTGEHTRMSARAVLLATGGCGQVYRETSNPPQATGDGMALAQLSGAEMMDMEFIQFHPTALAVPGAPRFLLSEALRGEGAVLRGGDGKRFLADTPQAELAPRDVVARAVVGETRRTGHPRVYLDMTHLTGKDLRARFPRIFETVAAVGLDLRKDLIPVLPAAHYAMGGVRTDLRGRTSVRDLFAAGEVAATGVHGANRLASNSLLEGLVFGARAGSTMLEADALRRLKSSTVEELVGPASAQAAVISAEVRTIAWERIGILRDAAGLGSALSRLEEMGSTSAGGPPGRSGFEARNLALVASMIARCALFREESRGAHHRVDHASRDDARWKCHTLLRGASTAKIPIAPLSG